MLDPSFKNMKVIQDYVNFFVISEIVIKFDTKIVYLVLLQVYVYLNDTNAPLQTFEIGLKWGTFQ